MLFSLAGLVEQPVLAQQTDQSLFQQAQTALAEERYADAETLLRKVVAQQPDSAEAYYTLGLSLHLQYQLEAAMVAYQQAIQLDPQYDSPYINLGLVLIEVKQFDEASALFRQVLTLPERMEPPASTHTLAHYNLAIIFNRQDNAEAALKAVQAALEITPEFAPAQKLLQQLQ